MQFRNSRFDSIRGLRTLFLALVLVPSATCQAQEQDPGLQEPVTLPATATWEFGLRITATGDTREIKASVPVPASWPEQDVRVVEIRKPEGVKVARIREREGASELFFNVPLLGADESVEVTALVEVTKHASAPPDDPHQWELAANPKGSLRKFLTPSPYIESDDPRIQDIAGTLAGSDGEPAWDQVKRIYDWVRTTVEYEFDTEIRSCVEALDSGHGDCEELSSLFIAICRARGIPARAVWIPSHTYPEFYLEDGKGNGNWFPCQAAGSEAFGYMPEARPILQKGDKFRVPGEREEARYLKPAVEARHSDGNLDVQWIMRPAEANESPDDH